MNLRIVKLQQYPLSLLCLSHMFLVCETAYKLADSDGYVAFYGTVNGTQLDMTFNSRSNCLDFCSENRDCEAFSFRQGASWQMVDCYHYKAVTALMSAKNSTNACYVKREFMKTIQGSVDPESEIQAYKFRDEL